MFTTIENHDEMVNYMGKWIYSNLVQINIVWTDQVHGRKWKYSEELPLKYFQTRCVFQWDVSHFPERGNFHTEETLPQLTETDEKF